MQAYHNSPHIHTHNQKAPAPGSVCDVMVPLRYHYCFPSRRAWNLQFLLRRRCHYHCQCPQPPQDSPNAHHCSSTISTTSRSNLRSATQRRWVPVCRATEVTCQAGAVPTLNRLLPPLFCYFPHSTANSTTLLLLPPLYYYFPHFTATFPTLLLPPPLYCYCSHSTVPSSRTPISTLN